MRKILLGLLLWHISLVMAMGADALARVEESAISEGSSVRLILEAIGEDVVFPQIDDIGGYPIESSSTFKSSSMQVVNGALTQESKKQLVLTFTPDKAMTIPSLKIKVDGKEAATDPIEIQIAKATPQTAQGSAKFTLEMVAGKQSVHLGEPLLLSVFFSESRSSELMQLEYQKPQTKDFIIKEVEKERVSRKGNAVVHELRYALIPKSEGNVTIEPARVKIGERSRRRDDFFGTFMDVPTWSQIASNPLSIEVKPLPKDTDLVGNFSLSVTIDATEVKANKPVHLTVKITGEGNLEDFEGAKYEIDGVTLYSDDAKIQSSLSGDQFVSSYEKKYVFIADHNFTIPAQSFSLFDTKTKTVKELKIESYSIEVTGGSGAAVKVVDSTPPKMTEGALEDKVEGMKAPSGELPLGLSWYWLAALAFFGGILFAWIGIKGLPHLKWQKSNSPFGEHEALKILYPHTNESAEVEEMVRRLYLKKRGEKGVEIDKKRLKELVKRYNK